MFTFPFYCPSCEQMADAMADPIGLLFANKGYTLKCSNCGTVHTAEVKFGATGLSTRLTGKLTPDDEQEE